MMPSHNLTLIDMSIIKERGTFDAKLAHIGINIYMKGQESVIWTQ